MVNTLPFPSPLSGQLTCATDSMPKIKVKAGIISAECCPPPSGKPIAQRGQYTTAFKRWAMAMITEDDAYLDTGKTLSLHDEEILRSRRFVFRDERGQKVEVSFRLPAIVEYEGGASFQAY